MYELVQVAANTYYINSPSKMGVYRVSDDDVWLIDSGNDKDAGRKVQKILEAQGWKLTAIINTQCRPYRRQYAAAKSSELCCLQHTHGKRCH